MKKNIRKKGKEYNYRGNLIFEGEFKNGKKYSGNLFNPANNEISGQLLKGNGNNIKEYDFYCELIFEGEYKKGKKYNGKIKEFNDNNGSSSGDMFSIMFHCLRR